MNSDGKIGNFSSVYMGTFDSERFWRDSGNSQLPLIRDNQANTIVSVMDELQFVFCNSSRDVMITRLPMNPIHKHYLYELGFTFLNNELPTIEAEDISLNTNKSICQLLTETQNQKYFKSLISPLSKFSPYSILPFTSELCKHYEIQNIVPDVKTVRKVNSKIFSHQLAKRLFDNTVGEIVYSSRELEVKGKHLIQNSPLLIKDEFGVSGKGNILIDSEKILERIVKHISKQENLGQKTLFLLEPLLDKYIDFSCQFEIDLTGEIRILSVQKMQNVGFAFSGIQTAKPSFLELLDRAEYFKQVNAIAIALYEEGYYGPVCLDSMLLKEGKIIPIVEINSRKSIGFINYYVDRFLSQFSTHSCINYFALGMNHYIDFEEILYNMTQKNILFLKNKPNGILPLSSNTLNINCKLSERENFDKTCKGRLYVSLVPENETNKELMLGKMKEILNNLGVKIFN